MLYLRKTQTFVAFNKTSKAIGGGRGPPPPIIRGEGNGALVGGGGTPNGGGEGTPNGGGGGTPDGGCGGGGTEWVCEVKDDNDGIGRVWAWETVWLMFEKYSGGRVSSFFSKSKSWVSNLSIIVSRLKSFSSENAANLVNIYLVFILS